MHRTPSDRPLVIPSLGAFYAFFHTGVETLLRVVCGLALVSHGYSKIQDPFGTMELVEGLGFYPGVFWSPLLAGTEFFGGLFLALGLLTRPVAVAATIVLLVTVWFNWIAQGLGYSGAETSIIWAAVTMFFMVRGPNRHSIDFRFNRVF